MVENLKMLKTEGMAVFLKDQTKKFRCPNCGGVVCVHDGRCFDCGYTKKSA